VSLPERLRVVESISHDPWFNLALEEWLFDTVEPGELVFYLWRNGPTVVIGRHQNPWVECRVEAMERDGVTLARRTSGGGAVFHDLGNTNFTFTTHRPHYSVERQIDTIVVGLGKLGVDAAFSGRNDIVVAGRKVSGSAFFGRKDRWLHHGTLLVDANLGRLSHYLTVAPAKIESKGVQSVRSRVANLSESHAGLDHARLCGALLESFVDTYGSGFSLQRMDPESMTDDEGLRAIVARFAAEEWRFGRTPVFTHRLENRFPWGGLELLLDVKKGVIKDATIHSDCLSVPLVDALVDALRGAAYRREDLARRILARAPAAAPFHDQAGDVATWLRAALPVSQ